MLLASLCRIISETIPIIISIFILIAIVKAIKLALKTSFFMFRLVPLFFLMWGIAIGIEGPVYFYYEFNLSAYYFVEDPIHTQSIISFAFFSFGTAVHGAFFRRLMQKKVNDYLVFSLEIFQVILGFLLLLHAAYDIFNYLYLLALQVLVSLIFFSYEFIISTLNRIHYRKFSKNYESIIKGLKNLSYSSISLIFVNVLFVLHEFYIVIIEPSPDCTIFLISAWILVGVGFFIFTLGYTYPIFDIQEVFNRISLLKGEEKRKTYIFLFRILKQYGNKSFINYILKTHIKNLENEYNDLDKEFILEIKDINDEGAKNVNKKGMKRNLLNYIKHFSNKDEKQMLKDNEQFNDVSELEYKPILFRNFKYKNTKSKTTNILKNSKNKKTKDKEEDTFEFTIDIQSYQSIRNKSQDNPPDFWNNIRIYLYDEDGSLIFSWGKDIHLNGEMVGRMIQALMVFANEFQNDELHQLKFKKNRVLIYNFKEHPYYLIAICDFSFPEELVFPILEKIAASLDLNDKEMLEILNNPTGRKDFLKKLIEEEISVIKETFIL